MAERNGSEAGAFGGFFRTKQARRPSPERRQAMVEPLEGRTLLAVVLPDGFAQQTLGRVVTQAAGAMDFAPDGRLFIADSKGGEVRVFKNGTLLDTPALELDVDTARERGLSGIVFDPDHETNRYLYVYYTAADPDNRNVVPNDAVNRLVRYQTSQANPDVIDPASETVLLDDIPSTTGNHNGGAMHFGADGMLYVGIGEAGVRANAQDLGTILGKVLRLDVSNPNDLVPDDNPFVDVAGARGEIFALGLRNPFTGAIAPGTNTLFINDVGASDWEEVNHIRAGENYGWPDAEGDSTNPDFVNPIHTYPHNGQHMAITGGVFYDGDMFPGQYDGKYFFADYILKWVKVLDPATGQVTDFAADVPFGILDMDVAPDGSLWTLSVGGNLQKFVYAAEAPQVSALTLYNADTEERIMELTDGATIDFAAIGTKNLSVVADAPDDAGSVRFVLDGQAIRTENSHPFAIAGDLLFGDDLLPWTPSLGSHTLAVTAYAGSDATGAAGATRTVSFNVVEGTPTPAGPSITKLTLFNADTDTAIMELSDGAVIDFGAIGTENLSVVATTSSGAESVRFVLDGAGKIENIAPYAIMGDKTGDLNPWTPSLGGHTLAVTAFAADGASGAAGETVTVNFTVTETVGPAVTKLTLFNADTDQPITELLDGAVIDVSAVGTRNLSVVATLAGGAQSVVFGFDGNATYQTENIAPYAIAGDKTGDLNPWVPSLGEHAVTATAYSAKGAGGTAGATVSVNFTLVQGSSAGPDITGLTLHNADSDEPIGALTEGLVVNRAQIGTSNLSVVAAASGAGSVAFLLNGDLLRYENIVPFAIAGDLNGGGDLNAWVPPVGKHTLTVIAYGGKGGGGTAGIARTVSFTVV